MDTWRMEGDNRYYNQTVLLCTHTDSFSCVIVECRDQLCYVLVQVPAQHVG